ncbi:MAG: hypothetical protein IT324_16465 [Anaerolineae bacterium]|nr:hypothetical protein [Anaerolineae bacterium]
MRRPVLLATAIVLLVGMTLAIFVAAKPTNAPGNANLRKKLIEYGWDAPTPDFVRANIRTMEQRPFDGVVVKLSVGQLVFTHSPHADSKFIQDQENLKATTFATFTDNFLIIWSSSEQGWNFQSESDWAAAEQNLRNFARTAAMGGFKGILFDTETYGQNTWAYNATTYPNTTFEQVQAVVRQRGARFMTILQSELPGVRVLFTFFLGKLREEYDMTGGKLVNGTMPLFGSFIDGMLSVVVGDVKLIDGNENAYYYTDTAAFDQSRQFLRDSVKRVAYDYSDAAQAHATIGQAIYADGLLNLLNSPRYTSFYLKTPQDRLMFLEHNVYHALRTSDEYVWFYSEHMDWWKKLDVPAGLEDAIHRARDAQAAGRTSAYDMRPVEAANQALAQAVSVYGQVFAKDGAPVKRAVIGSGFYNGSGVESACYSDPNSWFECKLPYGWSGTLTPSLKRYRFEPPQIDVTNLTQNYRVDFTAIPLTP